MTTLAFEAFTPEDIRKFEAEIAANPDPNFGRSKLPGRRIPLAQSDPPQNQAAKTE